LGLRPTSTRNFEVTVANGEKINSPRCCTGVCTTIQGFAITSDYYSLPLEGCDAVLRAQWLSTMGPIVWDFSKLQMKFNLGGREVILIGLNATKNKLVDSKEIAKEIRKGKKVVLLQINSLSMQTTQSELLSPPHDHKIPLKSGTEPVCTLQETILVSSLPKE